MRKPLALISALLVMLMSLVPFIAPLLLMAPVMARAQGTAGAIVTIRYAESEAFRRGIAQPPFRVAGVDAGLRRLTLIQARAINAFVTSGNRMFVDTRLIQQPSAAGEVAGVLAPGSGHGPGGGRKVGGAAGLAPVKGGGAMAPGELEMPRTDLALAEEAVLNGGCSRRRLGPAGRGNLAARPDTAAGGGPAL